MNWKELKEKLVDSEYHYFHTDNGVLLCGDCLEVMKEIPDKSIDLVKFVTALRPQATLLTRHILIS